MYKITNISNGARWCHDKVIQGKGSIEVDSLTYVNLAKLSPELFDIEVVKVNDKIKLKKLVKDEVKVKDMVRVKDMVKPVSDEIKIKHNKED